MEETKAQKPGGLGRASLLLALVPWFISAMFFVLRPG
jgi:hypothetical protein